MIISKDLNPERHVYYIGGLILNLIKTQKEIDFFDIFQKINKKNNISLNLYTLSLDWLYLLGLINQKEGKITKCS